MKFLFSLSYSIQFDYDHVKRVHTHTLRCITFIIIIIDYMYIGIRPHSRDEQRYYIAAASRLEETHGFVGRVLGIIIIYPRLSYLVVCAQTRGEVLGETPQGEAAQCWLSQVRTNYYAASIRSS